MQNLFRLRIEAPAAFQNQIYSCVEAGAEGESGVAALAEWGDRAVKAALEPLLSELRLHTEPETAEPGSLGARLEDLAHALDAALEHLTEEQQAAFDLAVVMTLGRSLYILHTDGLLPHFSVGGPPQALRSTLRVRVKDLLPGRDPEIETQPRPTDRMRLVRVFFEDEDRVVLWLSSQGAQLSEPEIATALAGKEESAREARIVVLKEPAPESDVLENIESVWPDGETEDETPLRDRATMSYAALGLVVVIFATALFGMSRWQRIGHNPDPLASRGPAFSGHIDSSLEPSEPSRVSSEVVEHGDADATDANGTPIQVAKAEPLDRKAAARSSPAAKHTRADNGRDERSTKAVPASSRNASTDRSRAGTQEQPLQVAWVKRYADWVTSSPRLVQGRVVYGCRDGHLYAVDPQGAAIWDYNSGAGIGATPAVDGTRVFCGNYEGRAFALRALDGLEIWRAELGARIVATPAVSRDHVFFQTFAGDVIALEKKSGRLAWRQHLGGQLRARPLVTRDHLVAISGTGVVFALHQKDGKTLWQRSVGAGVISNPAQVGKLVVFGSQDGYVNALGLDDGAVAWRVKTAGQVNSSPALDKSQDVLYIGSSDHRLYAIRAEDGEVLWRFRAQAPILSTPTVARDKVYVTAYDRHSYVVDAHDGALVAKIELGAPIYSSPMVHDGRVYFGSNDGTVYCLNVER